MVNAMAGGGAPLIISVVVRIIYSTMVVGGAPLDSSTFQWHVKQ